MQQNPCCVYDFTISCEAVEDNVEIIKIHLIEQCKHWTFQKEKGEQTGYEHFQGRLNLKVKNRLTALVKIFPGWHLSITSLPNRDNNFYVLKEETRIDGPWADSDPVPQKCPRDLLGLEFNPWQEQLKILCSQYQCRKVYIVYDPKGNTGKTTWARNMEFLGGGKIIPPLNDAKDLMRIVLDMGGAEKVFAKTYIIDMPRAMEKRKLGSFFAAIETIKGGYAMDDRYRFRSALFDPPNVVVFTNKIPDQEYLSPDRWLVFTIDQTGLKDFTPMNGWVNPPGVSATTSVIMRNPLGGNMHGL